MDKKISQEINGIIIEQSKEPISSTYMIDVDPNYDDIANYVDEEHLRIQILKHAVDSANKIIILNNSNEEKKAKWRGFFILFMSLILTISVVFIGVCLYNNVLKYKHKKE